MTRDIDDWHGPWWSATADQLGSRPIGGAARANATRSLHSNHFDTGQYETDRRDRKIIGPRLLLIAELVCIRKPITPSWPTRLPWQRLQ